MRRRHLKRNRRRRRRDRNRVHRAGLVEAGGDLPVLIIFVDFAEHVDRVLPKLFELVPHRLIVREDVRIEQGNLD